MIEEIKKYKLAWDEFIEIHHNTPESKEFLYQFDNEYITHYWNAFKYPVRKLYDYFDRLGIYGSLYCEFKKYKYDVEWYDKNDNYHLADVDIFLEFDTRQEAEQALFIEMFKIRNKQLEKE